MDLIGIFLSQLGVSKEELLGMAQGAAETVKSVDRRLERMETVIDMIAVHVGIPIEDLPAKERTTAIEHHS